MQLFFLHRHQHVMKNEYFAKDYEFFLLLKYSINLHCKTFTIEALKYYISRSIEKT